MVGLLGEVDFYPGGVPKDEAAAVQNGDGGVLRD